MWLSITLGAFLVAGSCFAPAMPFTMDGEIYYHMARAMADNGTLHIATNGGVDGAPALTKYLTIERDGYVYPQYPSGYAFLAAPFYLLLGLRGLIIMNAICAGLCLFFTHQIATRLSDEKTALWATWLFGATTFWSNYAFGIWPHMAALAFWLGAIWLTVNGDQIEDRRRQLVAIGLAGLLVGLGVNIRIDLILAAPAIFFWLRIFARPSDKPAAMIFLAALAPGLLIAAYLNMLKFGVFTPFSYGSVDGASAATSYLWIAPVLLIAVALMLLLDLQDLALDTWRDAGPANVIAVASVLLLLAILLAPGVRDVIYGVYVLVINLQAHNAYQQQGVELNEYGQLMFWGYPKRAFIQSLPFLPLIILPAINFIRGQNVVAVSLCLLCIFAPITFYALNQWHGGGSYNMRYFLPALPFVSILSAFALTRLAEAMDGFERQSALIVATAGVATFFAFTFVSDSFPALEAPAALYPQWVIAFILAVAVIMFLLAPYRKYVPQIALVCAGFAIAFASALNLIDEVSHEKAREKQITLARDIDAAFSGAPLIITQNPVSTMLAERSGASVMVITEDNIADIRRTVNAFAAAGRCVFVQNPMAKNLLTPAVPTNSILRRPYWVKSEKEPEHPLFAFYGLASQQTECAF